MDNNPNNRSQTLRKYHLKVVLFLRSVLSRLGVAVFRFHEQFHYVPNYYGPRADKSIDIRSIPIFGPAAKDVIEARKTSLYYDRLYTIFQALTYIQHSIHSQQVPVQAAEVGVYKGGTSHFILSVAQKMNIEQFHLHAFDTFEGHSPKDVKQELDAAQRAGQFSGTSFEGVAEYLSCFQNASLYKGRFQENAHRVEKLTFSLIHLDVDLYEPTLFGLDFFDKRLVEGGAIVVDDYGFTTCAGVKKAVDEFLHTHRDYFSLHLLTGQCLLVKVK